ncbi:flavin reductase [Anaerofustis butyriciformans]|uniref:flavin reductase n=1 Tax=Anaerofustis TaxID=264995 RepID=UPI003F8BDA0D
MNVNIFRKMSYGVYIASTMDGERPTGCTVNSIMQITSEPATIALSVNHNNYTNGCIEKTGKFAFSILSEDSNPDLIGNFGFKSGKDNDKFENVDYEMVEGVPVVKDSAGYVVCEVIDKMETSTHTVFLGKVIAGEVYDESKRQMTYAYYHEVIRGKTAKNAPTYIPEKEEEKKYDGVKYVCTICGYVYEGDPLPEDYKCPICGAGPDKFKKVE